MMKKGSRADRPAKDMRLVFRAGILFAGLIRSFAYLRFFMAIILIESHWGIWYNMQ